jgi:hypothetical protein
MQYKRLGSCVIDKVTTVNCNNVFGYRPVVATSRIDLAVCDLANAIVVNSHAKAFVDQAARVHPAQATAADPLVAQSASSDLFP